MNLGWLILSFIVGCVIGWKFLIWLLKFGLKVMPYKKYQEIMDEFILLGYLKQMEDIDEQDKD